MRLVPLDCVDNEMEKLLLKKERFWIGTICAKHKGLNFLMIVEIIYLFFIFYPFEVV